jgi:hypothetical protein
LAARSNSSSRRCGPGGNRSNNPSRLLVSCKKVSFITTELYDGIHRLATPLPLKYLTPVPSRWGGGTREVRPMRRVSDKPICGSNRGSHQIDLLCQLWSHHYRFLPWGIASQTALKSTVSPGRPPCRLYCRWPGILLAFTPWLSPVGIDDEIEIKRTAPP